MNKFTKALMFAVATVAALATQAHAAIDATAITDLTTDVPAVITAGGALLSIVLVGLSGLAIVKKVANKST